MNLQSLMTEGVEPNALQAVLQRRFDAVTRHTDCFVWPYQLIARDDTGRIRLRISYLWSERQWRWFYAVLPGDRSHDV